MKKDKKLLIGLGLDRAEEELRVTKGENYELYGGAQSTHEMMQEKAVKFNEELKRKKITMESVTDQEFQEIARKLDMPMMPQFPAPFSNN